MSTFPNVFIYKTFDKKMRANSVLLQRIGQKAHIISHHVMLAGEANVTFRWSYIFVLSSLWNK